MTDCGWSPHHPTRSEVPFDDEAPSQPQVSSDPQVRGALLHVLECSGNSRERHPSPRADRGPRGPRRRARTTGLDAGRRRCAARHEVRCRRHRCRPRCAGHPHRSERRRILVLRRRAGHPPEPCRPHGPRHPRPHPVPGRRGGASGQRLLRGWRGDRPRHHRPTGHHRDRGACTGGDGVRPERRGMRLQRGGNRGRLRRGGQRTRGDRP